MYKHEADNTFLYKTFNLSSKKTIKCNMFHCAVYKSMKNLIFIASYYNFRFKLLVVALLVLTLLGLNKTFI